VALACAFSLQEIIAAQECCFTFFACMLEARAKALHKHVFKIFIFDFNSEALDCNFSGYCDLVLLFFYVVKTTTSVQESLKSKILKSSMLLKSSILTSFAAHRRSP